MRCEICDRDDDLITFDQKTQKFTPCGVCEAAIQECLDGYDEQEEDDLED